MVVEYEAQQGAHSIRRSRSSTASSLGESLRLSPASDPLHAVPSVLSNQPAQLNVSTIRIQGKSLHKLYLHHLPASIVTPFSLVYSYLLHKPLITIRWPYKAAHSPHLIPGDTQLRRAELAFHCSRSVGKIANTGLVGVSSTSPSSKARERLGSCCSSKIQIQWTSQHHRML